MNLSKVLKRRLVNQFISVIVYADSCNIKQKIIKGSTVLHKEEFNYDINSKDDLGAKVTDFINSLQEKYNNTYIALFLNSSSQGIIPSCDKSKLESFHIDQKSVKTICKDGRFLMYSTWIDIKWADKIFAKTGLDFIFSPFLVLDFFISKFMKKESYNPSDVILYLLHTKNGIALMIMRGDKLLYGSFFNTAKEDDLLNIDYDENIESESLDELDLDSIDEMGMDDILDVADNSHFSSAMIDGVTMLSEEDERIFGAFPLKFQLKMRINGVGYGAVSIEKEELAGTLSKKQTNALVASLHKKSKIFWRYKTHEWQLSDKGSAAVLLKMDEYQER